MANRTGRAAPDARPAILLVDHGSRVAKANRQLEELAARLRDREPGRIVRVAHLEILPPSLGDGIDACVEAGAREIVVHPYFLAPGRHSASDIPGLVAEARTRHPEVVIAVSEPLGVHDKIVDVVLERVGATAPSRVAGSADQRPGPTPESDSQ